MEKQQIINSANEVLELSNGGASGELIDIYGDKDNFGVEDVSNGDLLFFVDQGAVTVDELNPAQTQDLVNLLQSEREEQTRINPMELDGKDPLTEHKDQLESTNEVDRSPQLFDERPMNEKEFAVVQSVMDSFAISNPQWLAEILSDEHLEADEVRSLFNGLGLDVDRYGEEPVKEQQAEDEAEL